MDKVLAALMLVLLSPVIGLIAFLIWRENDGPVIFVHRRVGTRGKPLNCLKFRTMRPESAEMLAEVLESDPIAREEWETSYKLDRDHRVTPLGRFLRKTSLDELPQLVNVLRGEMSLVGPRPVTAAEAEFYGRHFTAVTSARPGLTGLWQVNGRNDKSYDDRVALDLAYLTSRSLWMDIWILILTVRVVFTGHGAS